MKTHKKVLSVLLGGALAAAVCVGAAACADGDNTPPAEPQRDAYNMAEGGTDLFGKIMDMALSGVQKGLSSGISSVATSVGNWAAEGILNALGFSYSGEDSYQSEVLDRLDKIESAIVSLEGKVDWLTSSFNDQQYLTRYREFVAAYQDLASVLHTPYSLLLTAEKNLEAGTEANLEGDIKTICSIVRGTAPTAGISDLANKLNSFGYYFLGADSLVSQLGTASVFSIAERYVCNQTPYSENRYEYLTELLAEPYSAYYVGVSLAVLEYSYQLGECGIDGVWLDTDASLVGYRVGGEGEAYTDYLNCIPSEETTFREEHAAAIEDTPLAEESVTAQTINNAGEKGSTAHALCGNMSQLIGQYNRVNELYRDFTEKYTVDEQEGQLTLTDLNQKAKTTVRSVWGRDVLSVSSVSGGGDFSVKYASFGNITKADFERFAQTIEPYAVTTDEKGGQKYLTFREFFEREGFSFPTNNKSNYLLVGAQKGVSDKSDWYNNGYKWQNSVALVYVPLDTTVHDFVQNKNYGYVYYGLRASKISVNSNCGPKFEERWYLAETTSQKLTEGYGATDISQLCRYCFYTIDGLSASARTNTVSRGSLSF